MSYCSNESPKRMLSLIIGKHAKKCPMLDAPAHADKFFKLKPTWYSQKGKRNSVSRSKRSGSL